MNPNLVAGDELTGKWRIVSVVRDGWPFDTGVHSMSFNSSTVTFETEKPRPGTFARAYTIDEQRIPKAIDIIHVRPGEGPKCVPGIYLIDGNKLTIIIPRSPHTKPLDRPVFWDQIAGVERYELERVVQET